MGTASGFEHLKASVIDADLCCSCGTCSAACPEGAIRCDGADGLPRLASPEACLDCGACSEACPGRDVPYAELLGGRPMGGSDFPHFGPHLARFGAAAADPELRSCGASGGFVTAFLSYLLESGEMRSAAVTGRAREQPWRSVARTVTQPADLTECAGSHYTLAPANDGLREIEAPGVLVGLPCHVLGFRKLEQRDPSVSARAPLVVGLFCGVNLDPAATAYMLEELGAEDLSRIARYYSRSADHGGLRAEMKDGQTLKYPDHDSYAFDVVRLAPLFQRTRCALCFDNTNELADISVGDLPGPDRKRSCVVVRTPRALELVDRAVESGRILRWDLVDPNVHRPNVAKKKRRAFTVLEWMRQEGMPAVELDFEPDLADPPWASDAQRTEMLALRALARTDTGRRVLQTLPRNDLAYEVGLAYVGWRD